MLRSICAAAVTKSGLISISQLAVASSLQLIFWTMLKNRQDACSTKEQFDCGVGIMPAHRKFIENINWEGAILQSTIQISLSQAEIAEFCQRWKILEFYLFGSVLRNDFRPDSDIDVMVKFAADAQWGFEFVEIKRELEKMFQRDVDLLTKTSIEESHNWIRRKEILGKAKLVYVAK